MRRLSLGLVVLLLLPACVKARVPQPMAIKQANDQSLTCDQMAIEYKTNTEVAAAKIAKNNSDDTKEMWLGILVWPGLFDMQNADGTEGNAMLDRNIYLKETARSMKCQNVEVWPAQPERYS